LPQPRSVVIGFGAENDVAGLPIETKLAASQRIGIAAFGFGNVAVRCRKSRILIGEGGKQRNIVHAAELAFAPARAGIHPEIESAPVGSFRSVRRQRTGQNCATDTGDGKFSHDPAPCPPREVFYHQAGNKEQSRPRNFRLLRRNTGAIACGFKGKRDHGGRRATICINRSVIAPPSVKRAQGKCAEVANGIGRIHASIGSVSRARQKSPTRLLRMAALGGVCG